MKRKSYVIIITDYNKIKKLLQEKKQSKEIHNKISKSIVNLDCEYLRKIYNDKR